MGIVNVPKLFEVLRIALSSSGTTVVFKFKGESLQSLTEFAH